MEDEEQQDPAESLQNDQNGGQLPLMGGSDSNFPDFGPSEGGKGANSSEPELRATHVKQVSTLLESKKLTEILAVRILRHISMRNLKLF